MTDVTKDQSNKLANGLIKSFVDSHELTNEFSRGS